MNSRVVLVIVAAVIVWITAKCPQAWRIIAPLGLLALVIVGAFVLGLDLNLAWVFTVGR